MISFHIAQRSIFYMFQCGKNIDKLSIFFALLLHVLARATVADWFMNGNKIDRKFFRHCTRGKVSNWGWVTYSFVVWRGGSKILENVRSMKISVINLVRCRRLPLDFGCVYVTKMRSTSSVKGGKLKIKVKFNLPMAVDFSSYSVILTGVEIFLTNFFRRWRKFGGKFCRKFWISNFPLVLVFVSSTLPQPLQNGDRKIFFDYDEEKSCVGAAQWKLFRANKIKFKLNKLIFNFIPQQFA